MITREQITNITRQIEQARELHRQAKAMYAHELTLTLAKLEAIPHNRRAWWRMAELEVMLRDMAWDFGFVTRLRDEELNVETAEQAEEFEAWFDSQVYVTPLPVKMISATECGTQEEAEEFMSLNGGGIAIL